MRDTDDDLSAQFMDAMSQLSPNDQAAFAQLMEWMVQRPKDAEPLTMEKLDELLDDIKREQTRRLLGGKVGQVLEFKKPVRD